ncbi:MAG: hypothetical protein BRD48_03035 [Bacteroidetes bacterium QS_9_68_14]|nr:MAG: hypothetical protein BRD48_03035 [Bacteroidetes bacterium QS_9_68_14]
MFFALLIAGALLPVTLSITDLLPVLQAVAARCRLAAVVADLGQTPRAILRDGDVRGAGGRPAAGARGKRRGPSPRLRRGGDGRLRPRRRPRAGSRGMRLEGGGTALLQAMQVQRLQ